MANNNFSLSANAAITDPVTGRPSPEFYRFLLTLSGTANNALAGEVVTAPGSGIIGGGIVSDGISIGLDSTDSRNVDHDAVSISAGVGLSGGGNIAATRTIDLEDTAVTPDTYGDATHSPQITIDQQGRITGAVDVPIVAGIPDAPSDGTTYGRLNAAWSAVVPAVTSVDNTVARFDGTAGHIQGSSVTIADTTGNIATPGQITLGDGFGGSPGAGIVVAYSGTGGFLSSSTNGSTTNTIGVAGSMHSFFCGTTLATLQRSFFLQQTLMTLGGTATVTTVDFTITGHVRNGTNVLGGNLTISSGRGTGTGTVSALTFQTPTVGVSGTTAQTMATRLTLNSTNGTFTVPAIVPDVAYNATTWDGDLSVPTKNAVRDRFEQTSGVTAGSYTSANITVNALGIVTAASNGSGGGGAAWYFNPPAASVFTTTFSGDATAPTLTDDSDVGLMLQLGASATLNNVRGKGVAPPSGVDWSLVFRFTREILPVANCYPGISLFNGANSHLLTFSLAWESSTDCTMLRLTEFSLTGFNAHLVGVDIGAVWMFGKVDYDHTAGTLKFYYSVNGKIWHLVYSYTLSGSYLAAVPTLLGPSFVGYSGAGSIVAGQGLTLEHWTVT